MGSRTRKWENQGDQQKEHLMKSTLRLTKLTLFLATVYFAHLPAAHAVSPPPDGGYASGNTAEGTDALFSLTTGANNTAAGYTALHNNTNGDYNTATGANTLFSNISGSGNTAYGFNALTGNTIGLANTAQGKDTLAANTAGSVNTAIGDVALTVNTTGSGNTASGANALASNTTASNNTADGFAALFSNTTGANNTASGSNALSSNTTGSNNIALGSQAGGNLTSGNDNIDIGSSGLAGEAGTIRLGTSGIHRVLVTAGVRDSTIPAGTPVVVSRGGRLGIAPSSERFKNQIQPMGETSEAILALEPVTFRYRPDLDLEGIPQFGLVAEQVAKVDPELVTRDDQGKPYTVRYEAVNAMLLNEFLKEHRKVETQDRKVRELETTVRRLRGTAAQQKDLSTTVAQQQNEIEALRASLKRQELQIQKVGDQLEISKTASGAVVSTR
jgi:hypothetical protein